MRASAVRNNPRPLFDLSEEVAPGLIRLSQRGKLVAYVLLASHFDQEDIADMTDAGFWEMIAQRQKGPFIPWEQVKAEVVDREKPATSKKSTGRRKGKRDGIT